MSKRKRRLTQNEVNWIRQVMDRASMGRKPSIRWFANQLHVTRVSVIKSLGGWEGIQRHRPQSVKRIIETGLSSPIAIEPFTTKPLEGLNEA